MLSDKEIHSLIWSEVEPEGAGEGEGEEEGVSMLDLSHKEIRRLKSYSLAELNVEKVNASYNFFADIGSLNFKEFN